MKKKNRIFTGHNKEKVRVHKIWNECMAATEEHSDFIAKSGAGKTQPQHNSNFRPEQQQQY